MNAMRAIPKINKKCRLSLSDLSIRNILFCVVFLYVSNITGIKQTK
mgnify:CR=1 FL=1